MAIRSDIFVEWSASPRIIEVAAPSVVLTIQDLYDTLRSLGAEAIDEPEIIDGSGKESLGTGVLVGLTVKLLNAKVKFEDRPSPDWIVCSIGGGNLVAVDEAGEPISPVEPSAYTQVQVIMSAAGTITITGSGVTEQDKIDIANLTEEQTGVVIKAKADTLLDRIGVPTSTIASDLDYLEAAISVLPEDPTDESLVEAAIGTRASKEDVSVHDVDIKALIAAIQSGGSGFSI